MTAKLDGTNGLLQQYDYQTPTTGFSYTFASGTTVLVLDPAGTLATGTITMPAAPADGMTISFSSDQTITALTVNANAGQSIVGNPTTLLAGGAATFVYRLSNTTWYAQASTAAIGNTGSAAPVVTIYTSPSPWTKPATLKAIKVTVVGGGGAGGGRAVALTGSGGGGGGGAVAFGFFQAPAIPGPVTVTVGATATGTPGAVAGNPSSFGALITCTGGGAGGAGTGPNVNGAGGAGGTMTPSPQVYGLDGFRGVSDGGLPANPSVALRTAMNALVVNTTGGPSGFGFGVGGSSSPALSAGQPGGGYGGGGSGCKTPSVSSGGDGTQGIIIVEEFY